MIPHSDLFLLLSSDHSLCACVLSASDYASLSEKKLLLELRLGCLQNVSKPLGIFLLSFMLVNQLETASQILHAGVFKQAKNV